MLKRNKYGTLCVGMQYNVVYFAILTGMKDINNTSSYAHIKTGFLSCINPLDFIPHE